MPNEPLPKRPNMPKAQSQVNEYWEAQLAWAQEESKRRVSLPAAMVEIYAMPGDKEQAFHWLEKSNENRDDWITWLKTNPEVDSLRSDPRFKDLLRRAGLPLQACRVRRGEPVRNPPQLPIPALNHFSPLTAPDSL